MNTVDIAENEQALQSKRRFPIWAIVLTTIAVTALVMVLIFRFYFYPKPFDNVALNEKEEQLLDDKLAALIPGYQSESQANGTAAKDGVLEPEAYSEEGATREVSFNEREVNALLARNTDLADKLAVDLSNDLVSAKLLVPLEPDFPVMGGKTVRINAGLNLSYKDGKPVAILRGVSVMGVPVPSAWLGNLKNIDLVNEFGGGDGFWSAFAEGIEFLTVEDGQVNIKLKE